MVMDASSSPGTKAELTTILQKALDAAAKGRSTTLRGIYRYAEPVDRRGFVFMNRPGYDPALIAGQVASDAKHSRLHHRLWLDLRLQASALAEAGHQFRNLRRHGREDGAQLRRRA
jgi:hypothetical protein